MLPTTTHAIGFIAVPLRWRWGQWLLLLLLLRLLRLLLLLLLLLTD